jgi:hypothetical protein
MYQIYTMVLRFFADMTDFFRGINEFLDGIGLNLFD